MMFKELTEANGISGFEDEVADIMARYVEDVATVSYDKLGSLVAEKRGKTDGPRVMIAGHMDEIGFMVKNITKEGFIKFLPIGGWWGHVALSQRVQQSIWNRPLALANASAATLSAAMSTARVL